MLATVFLVPKTEDAVQIPLMRPITVFSLIYRVWAEVTARRIMLKWKIHLPSSIVGGVPGRSFTQLSLSDAVKVGKKLQIGCDGGGFSLDIEKCFNGFGRLPLCLLLRYHGIGCLASDAWIASLSDMTQRAMISNSVSMPVHATTGLAEGDPLSVCGMIAAGYTW